MKYTCYIEFKPMTITVEAESVEQAEDIALDSIVEELQIDMIETQEGD